MCVVCIVLIFGILVQMLPCVDGTAGVALVSPCLYTVHRRRLSRVSMDSYSCNETRSDALPVRATMYFDFRRVPYAVGLTNIHSPQKISLFQICSVEAPKVDKLKASIRFTSWTPFATGVLHVHMFALHEGESNLLFFKDGRRFCRSRMIVSPFEGRRSHRLQLDVVFFSGSDAEIHRNLSLILLHIRIGYCIGRGVWMGWSRGYVDKHFVTYRRSVLRMSPFWSMAESVIREYTG